MLPISSHHVDCCGLVQQNSVRRRKSPGYITTTLKQAGDAVSVLLYVLLRG